MKLKKLNIALIGAGGIGKIWADAFLKARDMRLAAVVDTDAGRAAAIAKNFPGCKVLKDWKPILRDESIHAAIVATPHALLAPISGVMLAAGKHVLCEKPGGVNSAEVKKNITVAGRKKVVYMIGFVHRFHPSFIMARQMFDEGKIGKLMFIRGRHGFGGRAGYEKEWRFNKTISGGGELIDQGMHLIDMSRWFLGEFKNVSGFAENLFWGGKVEDNGFLLMRTKDKKIAQIHVSWTNWDWIHSFEIFGDHGYFVIDGLDQRYKGPERLTVGVLDPRKGEFPKEETFIFEKEHKTDSFARQLMAFHEAVNGTNKTIPTGKDSYEALKIVEAVYKKK